MKEENSETFFGKKISQVVKKPSMYYVSIFDVMYDRTKGLANSPYTIIRTFATGASIKEKILPLIMEEMPAGIDRKAEEKKFDALMKSYKDQIGSRFSLFDYNPVKSLTSTTQFYNSDSSLNYNLPFCKSASDIKAGWAIDGTTSGNDEQKNNYFLNAKASTYELVEYSTSDEKVVFVN